MSREPITPDPTAPQPTVPEPMTVRVPESDLADLRDRLRRTRWPEPATVPGWDQGVPLAYLRRLCEHWAEAYDWRRTEARLNGWPQFRMTVDGLRIHLLHVRSPHPGARPLLLTHGWPGSILEFGKIIGPLTDPPAHGGSPSDAFDVVCPSLPGYGFSDKPDRQGWGVERIAAAWATLMHRLGYDRYLAMGSDWGTSISTLLGEHDPDHVAGVHLVPPLAPPDPATFGELTDWERQALADLERATGDGSAYSEMHRTRPQTSGYALLDSPVALCAWIAEKFHDWADLDNPDGQLTDDDLLDGVTLYWLTGTGASAARLYWESIRTISGWFAPDRTPPPVHVPIGASVFGRETPRISRRWAERRYTDIRSWRVHDHGGHFAALESPEALVDDVRQTARSVW